MTCFFISDSLGAFFSWMQCAWLSLGEKSVSHRQVSASSQRQPGGRKHHSSWHKTEPSSKAEMTQSCAVNCSKKMDGKCSMFRGKHMLPLVNTEDYEYTIKTAD